MNVKNKKCKQHPWRPRGNWSVEQGLKNVPSGRPGQLDSPSGNFLLLLAQWARDQASHLPTKSLKEQNIAQDNKIQEPLTVLVPRASWNSIFFFFNLWRQGIN